MTKWQRLQKWIVWTPRALWLVIAILYLIVPLSIEAMRELRVWGLADSPARLLSEPYFWVTGIGRVIGAYLLGALLLLHRKPTSIAVTIVAVWLGGPPITFLMSGITLLADSAGQASMSNSETTLLWQASFLPALITALLLGSRRVRQIYGLMR